MKIVNAFFPCLLLVSQQVASRPEYDPKKSIYSRKHAIEDMEQEPIECLLSSDKWRDHCYLGAAYCWASVDPSPPLEGCDTLALSWYHHCAALATRPSVALTICTDAEIYGAWYEQEHRGGRSCGITSKTKSLRMMEPPAGCY